MNQEVEEWGKPKAKRQAKAEQNHKGESARQWHNYVYTVRTPAANIHWPTAYLPVNSDY